MEDLDYFSDDESAQCLKSYTKRITRHENGQINEEYFIDSQGKINGEYKEWDENGIIIAHHYYENNVEKKRCTDFYENGNKKYETELNYSDENLTKLNHYYMNGQLRSSTERKDSDLHGLKIQFYENGNKREETYYQDYYKSGISQKWFPNGQLEVYEEYGHFEKLNGYRRVWKQNGDLIKEEVYENGVLIKKTIN